MKKRKRSLHISLDLVRCRRTDRFVSKPTVIEEILKLVRESGCIIRKCDYEFYKNADGTLAGYEVHAILAESHFWVSTWPEKGFANIDIFVCNFTKDNSPIARSLAENIKKFFGAGKGSRRWDKWRGPE